MVDWQMIFNMGFPAAALIAVCTGAWKLGNKSLDRLLNKSDGIVTQMAADNHNFLDGLAERHTEQLAMCNSHGIALVSLNERFADPMDFSTVAVRKALANKLEAELITMRANTTLENGDKARVEELLISAKTMLEATG